VIFCSTVPAAPGRRRGEGGREEEVGLSANLIVAFLLFVLLDGSKNERKGGGGRR